MISKKPLAVALSLATLALAGCGGGDSSGSTTPTYTIQFVVLAEDDADNIASTCEVYAKEELYEEDETATVTDPEPTTVNKVFARKYTGTELDVLIHDATGAVVDTYTASSSEWSSTGLLRIKQSVVPTGGFLTVMNAGNRGSSIAYVDGLTIQKSLLQNSMMINTVYESIATSTGCIAKVSAPTVYERTGDIYQDGDGNGVFGFNTSEGTFHELSGQDIDFESTNTKIIAARYVRESDDSAGMITGYAFTTLSAISTASSNDGVELKEMTADYLPWYIPMDMTLSSAELNVLLPSNESAGIRHWQSLSTSEDGYYGYASDVGSNYFLLTEGSYNSWDVNQNQKVTSISSLIDQSDALSSLALPSVNTSQLEGCSTSAVSVCLNTYSASSTAFSAQRTLAYVNDNTGQDIRLIIYSEPNASLPMMSFGNSSYDAMWNDDLVETEVSLLKASDADTIDTFTESYFEPFSVVREEFATSAYTDSISLVTSLNTRISNARNITKANAYLLLEYREEK